eukprot:GHVT01053518.1.p3 GENE.GHVT01053518.1~~GHVT01053518.1.p3  ORF type:complete len:109 (+),score=17.46 GHVT01053518.1:2140-2466(+)
MIIQKMTVEPLEASSVKGLFEEQYGIPWDAPGGLGSPELGKILKLLGLNWSAGKRQHLLEFFSGNHGATTMSAASFVEKLQEMDREAIQAGASTGGAKNSEVIKIETD